MKLLFSFALFLSFFISGGNTTSTKAAIAQDPKGDVRGPLDLKSATVSQTGPKINMRWDTYAAFRLSNLGNNKILCMRYRWDGKDRRQICLVKNSSGQVIAYATSLDSTSLAMRKVAAKITRSTLYHVNLTIEADALKLPKRFLNVRAFSHWSPEGECPTGEICRDYYPNSGYMGFSYRSWALASCTMAGQALRYSGPTSPKKIAISFDDGPGPYTTSVLNILDRYNARATFYVNGVHLSSHQSHLRRMVRSGNYIANHSWGHEQYPGYNSLRNTNSAIRNITGFKPCTFRPPYGSFNSTTIANAKSLGMNTIIWSVDTQDWSRPGTSAIINRALTASSGDIILFHDAGGNRSQTVAALPTIISRLQARGYQIVPVEDLLRLKTTYRYL